MANCCASADILNTTFSLINCVSNSLWSWKFTKVGFWLTKFKNDIEIALRPTGFWAIGKSYQNLPFNAYL